MRPQSAARCSGLGLLVLVLVALVAAVEAKEPSNDKEDSDYDSDYSGDYDDDKEISEGFDESTDVDEDEDDDDDGDAAEDSYSYNYEDGASGGKEAAGGDEAAVHLVPEILSQPLTLNVSSGQTVEMPCQAKNAADFVRLWTHGDAMLFTGRLKMSSRDGRFTLKEDEGDEDEGTLVLAEATPEDAGTYVCRIMAEKEISVTHTLVVSQDREEEEVKGGFNVKSTAGPVVTALEGSNATLSCSSSSSSLMTSWSWHREGPSAMRHGGFVQHGSNAFVVHNVTRADAGHYFCTATNQNGDKASASVLLSVQFPPSASGLALRSVRAGAGKALEIACAVNAEPKAKITWYKGKEVLPLSAGRAESVSAGSRHVLVLQRLSLDDAATYMCYAKNDLGTARATVDVTVADIEREEQQEQSAPDGKLSAGSDAKVKALDKEVSRVQEMLKDLLLRLHNNNNINPEDETGLAKTAAKPTTTSERDSTLDLSVFADLERMQLEIGRVKESYDEKVGALLEFRRVTRDELQRAWDTINDLQEAANVTAKHVEDMYEKDIIRLQDFQTDTKKVLAKLKSDLSSVMESASSSSSSSLASDTSQDLTKRLQALESEARQTRKDVAALQKSQSLLREDVQRVFGDIDGQKKAEQTALQDREMLQRDLNQLRQVGLADLEGGLRDANAKLAEMAEFRLKATARLDAAAVYDHGKFELLAKDMQRIKSQIYYLQQSLLQMKVHGSVSTDAGVVATAAGNATVSAGDMASLQKQVLSLREQCVAQDAFLQERERVDQEMALVRSKLDSEMDKVDFRAEKLQLAQTGLAEAEARIDAIDGALEEIVAEARKYNLLLTGLPQEHLIERPAHVMELVSAYLANVLGLADAVFDEAERSRTPAGSIRVKFPNLREKARVLERSRTNAASTEVSVSEDYSDRVALRRRRLAAFARARAKVLRKKWALRHDELYFNGKVFVFDEKADKVVVKKTFQNVE